LNFQFYFPLPRGEGFGKGVFFLILKFTLVSIYKCYLGVWRYLIFTPTSPPPSRGRKLNEVPLKGEEITNEIPLKREEKSGVFLKERKNNLNSLKEENFFPPSRGGVRGGCNHSLPLGFEHFIHEL